MRHEIGVRSLDSSQLIDRNLPLLELRGFLILRELPQQKLAADFLLIRKSLVVDYRQPHQKALLALEILVIAFHRIVRDLIVPALIAERRGEFR